MAFPSVSGEIPKPSIIVSTTGFLLIIKLISFPFAVKTDFENKKEFDAFVKLIKGRSTFKTRDKIEYGDKILTLSTCANNGKRLVVHAVLIKE